MADKSMRDMLKRELNSFLRQTLREKFKIKEINLLEDILSPVRNQGEQEVCSLVSSVASIEMLSKKMGVKYENTSDYYFDINEVHSNLYKQYPNEKKANNPKNVDGSSVPEVLKYIQEKGLVVTSIAADPRVKDMLSKFCNEYERQKIISYEMFTDSEVVFKLSKHYPIIAGLYVPWSFIHFDKIIYNGRAKGDDRDVGLHAVLIVGNATVVVNEKAEQTYFLIQNSWGKTFGCQGFVFIPTKRNILTKFWIPIINEKMHRELSEYKKNL